MSPTRARSAAQLARRSGSTSTSTPCWERVKSSERPLAQDEAEFRRLYEERRKLYAEVADVVAKDVHDVVLAAAGVVVERGALQRLGELVPGEGGVALVSDPHVAGIHGVNAQIALGRAARGDARSFRPARRRRRSPPRRLWEDLARRPQRHDRRARRRLHDRTPPGSPRRDVLARRAVDSRAQTSLVAQVDAAIGGKTAIDLPQGKNLVGAFHWPVRTVIDPALLRDAPQAQRLEGMAES